MPSTPYTFPFGEPVRNLEQRDRDPKRVFVLGVYASAVHAQWIGVDGETKAKALAVASEPYIFWRGESASHIIDHIQISPELGKLVAAPQQFNGPSGRALDEYYLKPLNMIRADAWLCDLVPHSCQNNGQRKAVERAYFSLIQAHNLPPITLPPVPKVLADSLRQQQILAEIQRADPEVIILLGDAPIKWFLSVFDDRWSSLSDFGYGEKYGKLHFVKLQERRYSILPLVHPRQAAGLGGHSKLLFDMHQKWMHEKAGKLIRKRFYY